MVLESVVADLLNRFLGCYVENLNKSQLKLGIWGGNVSLDNLLIKENALVSSLGVIDKLTLKIPWKNLYGEAVIASLEGLYLLVVPGASIKYDAEKEEQYLQDNKQKELSRIEEALQKSAEKGRKSKKTKKHFKKQFKAREHSKDKPKEQKKDTFLEKLATQVIKNVQVKITGIHIKYEDDITDPKRPISLGMTLAELSLQTTNENWTPCILNEAARIIYKLLSLDSLSVYWNVESEMYYRSSREQILSLMSLSLFLKVFKPVSASAKLYLNPHAEEERETPKVDCAMEVQSIAVELTKPQYLSMIDLLESIDYMVRNAPYRKYRPGVSLHGNAQQWWKYAGNCILDLHIKRYAQMWSWNHIKSHRQLLKSYKNIYKLKLTQAKLSEETQKQIQDLERALDVFNIVLARQQAQTEVVRSGQKLSKKSADREKKSGWFSGFWGSSKVKPSPLPAAIDDLMTPEEKAKLFTAIGYSDSSHNLALPKKYVAHVVSLKLLSTSVTIKEDRDVPDTLKIQIIDLSTKISQRPGAQALKIEAKLEHWYMTGLRQEDIVPSLVASIGGAESSLLEIKFETNPEDSMADQSLFVQSQPIEIIYDARTINALVEFFQTDRGLDLERLTTATLSKLEEIKEKTATGLMHIIETRKVLDLRVNLKPSYLLIPQTGFRREQSNLLILDLGTFQLKSVGQGHQQNASSSLEEIMDKAYDKFDVEIKNVQLLFGRSGEDWKKARSEPASLLHILRPMDLCAQVAKSMVEKDVRMAKFKVSGGLPLVHLRISDQKIKGVLELIDSIPLPQKPEVSLSSAPAIPVVPDGRRDFLGATRLLEELESESEDEYFDSEDYPQQSEKVAPPPKKQLKIEAKTVQEELTDLQLKFEIKEVILELTKQLQREETILVFNVQQLGMEAIARTFDLRAETYLRKISLNYYEIQGKRQQVHLISSSDVSGLDLLKVEYIKADKNGPKFQTVFDNTEQRMEAASPWKEVAKPSKDKGVFNFKFFAKMEAFCLNVCDEKSNIAEIKVQGLDSFLFLQPSQTILFARLKDVVVIDVDSRTIHRKAVSIVGDEVFSFNLALYPDATEGEAYTDMSKVDGTVALKVGCIQIIYLHKFLMSLLNFLSSFQVATEALSAATVQAAEKAATSMRDFAQRSFRLSMDIHLKAPVIIVPQSSVSCNAVVFDLGLIKIQNQFSLVPAEDCSLPPIMDKMEVHLTQLKLSRTILHRAASQPDIQILRPINLELSVSRNLAGMWYHKIPLVEVRGYLDTIGIILSQEDLNVLLKVMNENLAEADKTDPGAEPAASAEGRKSLCASLSPGCVVGAFFLRGVSEGANLPMLFCGQVVVTLTKQVERQSFPLYRLTVLKLGSEGRIKMHDMTLTAYLKKVQMNCLEFTGKSYLMKDFTNKCNSDYTQVFRGQLGRRKRKNMAGDKGSPRGPISSCSSGAAPAASPDDAFDLKLTAKLSAFNILVCDQKADIADIRIQGMEACVFTTTKQTEVFARLRDFIITNVDPETVHKKTVSILGDEVFRFTMSLYSDATQGDAYMDTSKVDGKMSLKVGCVQIVYVHKFFMTLLHFLNHFQTAKEALSAATVQAAEKAASSVKKSFRLSMDINLKAPVILIPQSSVSNDVLVADLGLIRVWNEFTLVSREEEEETPPPVIDKMDIQLTQLKISRTVVGSSPQPDVEILQPVNLRLSVQRNLASDWYLQIPGIAIQGDLKAMLISLSQNDLTLVMNILLENLSEAVADPKVTHTSLPDAQKFKKPKVEAVAGLDEGTSFPKAQRLIQGKSQLSLHNSHLRLGELRLHFMSSSGQMFSDGSLDVSTKMETCTLDDLREGVEKATARMLARKDGKADSVMIDIDYKQNKNGSDIVAVLDQLYLCASMEFLLTVADFFIQSVPAAKPAEKPAQFALKPASQGKPEKAAAARPNMSVVANILDPEIVFVANLTKADAPALAASFQCSFMLSGGSGAQQMTARVVDVKVLACPFLRGTAKKDVTTVVHPCSLTVEAAMDTSGVQSVDVNMDTLIVSPIILNTVMTILAAMKRQDQEEESEGTLCNPVDLWSIKSVDECQSWFLGVDMATEATEALLASEQSAKKEHFGVEVKSVQVTLECGLGHRTVPLLLAESAFSGAVKNWSSLMSARADLTLEMNYYNETHALWEPLIEQVDREGHRWNLKLEMKTNPEQDRALLPGDDFIILPEPRQLISISSKDTMNITMSKCCLTVLNNLAKGFSEGTASTYDATLKDRAPFTVRNALGIPVRVHTCRSLQVVGFPRTDTSLHELGLDQSLELEYATSESLDRRRVSILRRQDSSLLTLSFGPEGYSEISAVPIAKPGRRLHSVRAPQSSSSNSVVVQIDAEEGNKVITLRSPLQIKNHFSVPFIIYKFVKDIKQLKPLGVSLPEEEFHVPLDSYRCQLYVQPTGTLKGQYEPSTTYISWQEELHRSSEVTCMLQCPASDISFLPLRLKATAEPDELNFIATHKENWEPAYLIHFYPTLTLQNLLPYTLQYILEGMAKAHELHEGSAADVLHARIGGELMELILLKYQGRDWNGHLRVHDALPEFFPVCFTSQSAEMATMDLYVHVRKASTHTTLSVYSPYWIINKTSRVLQYRAEDVYVKHPADFRDTVLFSFKKKNIFSKNKIQLCVSTSTWSSSFSLDTVGNSGCVKCPAGNMDFLVGVTIQMSSFNLTRIVTLTPFYTITNTSSLELEFGEMGADGSFPTNKWNYFSPSECVAFWPENPSGKLCIRVSGSEQSSKPFFYNQQDNGMLLSLEEMNTGILVNVSVAEHSVVINVSDYYEGAAPALVINQTSWATLKYQQSGLQEAMELKPKEVRLFAWADPTGTRKLSWNYAQNTGELDLLKDECGQFSYNANTPVHWVSFLDGRQRVLLFTEDVALVSKARQAEEMEQPDQEVNIALQGLGLSLVNNNRKQEISYIGITSSGIVWELKPKQRWKPFNQKHINLLEQVYQRHISGPSTGPPSGWIKINNNFEINFDKVPMEMRLPFKCIIKRDFLSAIQIEFKQSAHQKSLRAQLYWLQVDNQLPGSMFPVVFHPVAPPKSIALDSEPRPFIDVSIIIRFNEYSKVLQFKYFMVLVQEMAVKLDQGFLAAVIDLFTPATDPEAEKQKTGLIQKDIDALNTELLESSLTDVSTLSFFEHFHISPLKLHLSLSLGSGSDASESGQGDMIAIHSVNLLLKSIGATLTDVDDLVFKLACFEIKYRFYKRKELLWRVIGHYRGQFLKQMYILVLGLDVLGNPFGLIRGLSEGVEALFYEPFQGAVQGPEEFAEGFVIGVKSLLGHTVGGAAGVVSRITGSVGKGLAAITMDKEFQQKRREEMGRQPKDFGDSLAKGGKGFLRGVVGGVTGIVTKPVEGAKKEGAAGFFKGIGKGLVGVVARPTGGIIDMASSTFQGIQRVAESTEEVSSLRPPRLIREDGIIRPYDRGEADGCDLFENSHIKKLEAESFQHYCPVPGRGKAYIVVTSRRVILMKEVEILGHMTTDWDYLYEDFTQRPRTEENLLQLFVKVRESELGMLPFPKKESSGQELIKQIRLQDAAAAKVRLP
uniref:Vacuolar protein sorting 13 homolog C n=1 Tax=Pseudonaja textilis TaxID=8673 RepID=A0A670Z3U9_PSETE